MLTPGSVLDGRYEILGLLASGGMGQVYRARRVMLGDEVAIKVILPSQGEGDLPRERFLRESRTCAQLRHPHIVSILDFDVDGEGRPFLVMEYLNGPSLRQDLTNKGRLDLQATRQLTSVVASALQLAHDRGIVHRDLKPANIVSHRYETGEVVHKLIDFGIANMRDPEETRATGRREFLGTVAYASPEQIRGDGVDARSDVYSLGAVVFELLTGRPPFQDEDPLALAMQHLTAPSPRPSELVPELPPFVDHALLRALAKRPADRWTSAVEFARALGRDDREATSTSAASPDESPGWLGQYELRERIGRGRFGSEVYAAVHRALGHPVAIRTLRRGAHPKWEVGRDRFLREARLLQLAHPSVMQVRDYGEDGDVVYVVTELYEGSSLRDLLMREGFLSWPRLAPLVRQLASAAGAVHKRGGLLCGLTPDMIRMTQDEAGERLMVSSGGVCEVQDLTAMLSDEAVRGAGRPDQELYYIPPELHLGEAPGVPSDLFTIGAIAYEMATGRRPYEAATLPMLLGAMLRTHPTDPRHEQPLLPAAAAAMLLRALDGDRARRPASAAEFAEAFAER